MTELIYRWNVAQNCFENAIKSKFSIKLVTLIQEFNFNLQGLFLPQGNNFILDGLILI